MPSQANPPPGITKLKESIWELHSPKDRLEMEIIFFHGLQLGDFENAFWETWLARDSKQVIWPKEWLGQIFPNARILSVSYNSCAKHSEGQLNMYKLGENLVDDIILDRILNIGQNCPVFLVGHSWGGIVMKQLVLSAIHERSLIHNNSNFEGDFKRLSKFYDNLSGLFYYATPHLGSRLADWASRIPGTSPIVTLLKTLDTVSARINSNFTKQRNIPAYAVGEALDTPYRIGLIKYRVRVVEEASSRHDIDNYYTIPRTDHFTICKPQNTRHSVITKLVDLIITTLDSKNVSYTRESAIVENLQ